MFVDYVREKLNEIAEGFYDVSKERDVNASYEKSQVVVSALSGNIYKESASIPYQIDIVTNDIDSVMVDFTTLGRNYNNVSYTEVTEVGNNDYRSVTITPFFNTPVVMEKDIQMGSEKYARIVVFASVIESYNVNNVRKLSIDGEEIEFLNASLIYSAELNTNRVSGLEMNVSKKKASSCSITFSMVNKAGVFSNKAFKVACGKLSGNTSFDVSITLDNGMTQSLKMLIASYTLGSERSRLPSLNVGMFLYDDRGDSNA